MGVFKDISETQCRRNVTEMIRMERVSRGTRVFCCGTFGDN
jgi:hypothetical protein